MKLAEFCARNFKSIENASLFNVGSFNILVGRKPFVIIDRPLILLQIEVE